MNGLRNLYIPSIPLLVSPAAVADLPLTIEDLVAKEAKARPGISLPYVNSESPGLSTGDPVVVQTGESSFVVLLTRLGEFKGNTDAFVGTLGLTTCRAIDPAVLSVTESFPCNQERDDGEASYEAGYRDDEPQGFDRTSTDLTPGPGCGVANENEGGGCLVFPFRRMSQAKVEPAWDLIGFMPFDQAPNYLFGEMR